MAVPRARAAHRARHPDLPLRARACRRRRAGWRARRAARAVRQPNDLSAALRHDRGARAGDRSGHARSQQSAFGGLSARPHRGASGGAAQASPRRPPVAAAADRGLDRNQLAHRGCGDDRRRPDPRQRKRTDEALRDGRHLAFDAQRTVGSRVGGAGMIYDIRQTTTYDYASKVAYAHHVLRLMLINRPGQRVHAAALEIIPVPVERREGFDFFGNHVTWIGLEEAHDRLSIKVAARVAVEAPLEPVPRETPPWEEVRA